MLALTITDTKSFMAKLLTQDTFDTFLFSEGTVTTFTTFTVDGTWHPEFFQSREMEDNALTWNLLRPIFYSIIKGSHTPIHLRIGSVHHERTGGRPVSQSDLREGDGQRHDRDIVEDLYPGQVSGPRVGRYDTQIFSVTWNCLR